MINSKEELVEMIERARQDLNQSIDARENYESIYKNSVELDGLIDQYITEGY